MLSVSQDWVPILDKVFGQKWCNNIKELEGGGGGGSGHGLCEGRDQQVQDLSLTLEPTPSSPQQDPRWTPLEDMEVFSPDQDSVDNPRSNEGGASSEGGDVTVKYCKNIEAVLSSCVYTDTNNWNETASCKDVSPKCFRLVRADLVPNVTSWLE